MNMQMFAGTHALQQAVGGLRGRCVLAAVLAVQALRASLSSKPQCVAAAPLSVVSTQENPAALLGQMKASHRRYWMCRRGFR